MKCIPRVENTEVDELAKAVVNNLPMPEGTFYQELTAPTIIGLNKAFKDILLTESED